MSRIAVALAATVATAIPSLVRANTSEDIMGVSARTSALGGAGTALPNDFTAAYYNPAALSFCREQMLGIDVRHTYYRLRVARDAASTAGAPENAPNYTRLTAGLCIHLPLNLSLGTMLGLGIHELLTDVQSSPNTNPRFPLYGQSTEQMTLLLGLGWRPKPWFAVGIGVSIFLDAYIPFSLEVPISMEDPANPAQLEPLALDLNIHMHPKVAPYVGVMIEPRPHVRVGVTYRDPLYAQFQLPATVDAKLVGLDLLIPLMVQAVGWYSPRQVAVGVSGEPAEHVVLTGDVTWYDYKVLNHTPYPFLSVTPTDNGDGITDQIGFPHVEHPGWKNAWAVRAGAELGLADDKVALRAGYALKTSAISLPAADSNVNLLDGLVHQFTLGAGWSPLGHEHPHGDSLHATVSFDAFFRASVMPDQRDDAKAFTFGGTILDAGVMATMGW